MTLKALIIDDEEKPRKVLRKKLEEHCPAIKIVGEADDIHQAYRIILKTRPDLLFLDITLPSGTGFDLLDKFKDRYFEVIFVTGYNEFALQAFKVSAIDYLLKPISTNELVNAVERATQKVLSNEKAKNFDLLRQNLKNPGDQKNKIAVPGSQSYEFVTVSNLIRCEGWQKYTRLHLKGGDQIISSYSIGRFRDLLAPYGFYSCHKSHLINTQHITKYLKSGKVIMSDEAEVPVSRRRKEQFQEDVIRKLE
ncbi:MAG: response regulator transcription factor [Saprospiraceae bacterium]|nr:response regulator transcription factor [Saprospiraceae bacterium]